MTIFQRKGRVTLHMLSSLSTQRKGELFVLSSSLIWALFPTMTVLLLASVPPILLAGLSMLASCVLFAALLTMRKKWDSVRKGKAMKEVLLGTLINGVMFHGIVFFAISHTTAGSASITLQMEVFFAFFILSLLIKHESFHINHFVGAILMVLGALLILLPQTSGNWQSGNLLIVLATAIAPVGNYFQQKARLQVPAEHILLIRSFIAGIFLILLSKLLGETFSMEETWSIIPFIFLNGFLMLGLAKIFWIEGIACIPITKGNSLATIVPFFGLTFAFLILGEVPTVWQLLSVVPIALGILLLMRKDSSTATVRT